MRIESLLCDSLPVIPPARREVIRALPSTREAHAALVGELPFIGAVEVAVPPRPIALPGAARVLAWNAERCRDVAAAAAWLARAEADVLLLSELDWGMARSGQLHTARELAGCLGLGYAYAVEFLELDLGSEQERAELAERGCTPENRVGYHGSAILSQAPLRRLALVRLDDGGEWFDGARGERRVGGRVALLAQIELGGAAVAFACVHLESHGDPAQRAAQMQQLLDALERYAPKAPAVIGGDLNTFSLSLAELGDAPRVTAALQEDPERWRYPERHEPLFRAAAAAGFAWEGCNALGVPTHRHQTGAGSARGQLKLDWLLCRGVRAERARVIEAVDAATGRGLSDHEAVEALVTAPRPGTPAAGMPRPKSASRAPRSR